LNKYKTLLYNAITFYDENKTGYITFLILRKILEQIRIKLKNNLIEYFIFVMKSFNDEKASINDLKYELLFKILKEKEDEIFEEEAGENETNEEAEEESAIEISSDEYLRKVSNVVRKIKLGLKSSKTSTDEHFLKFILPEHEEYRALELARLVQILNEEFNIILDSIDIYCLFTKLKHSEGENDNDSEIEEIIDYDKLIIEIKNCIIEDDDTNMKEEKNKSDPRKQLTSASKLKKKSKNNIEIDDEEKESFEIPSDDFIQLIKNHLRINKLTYEDFIFEIKNKIENAMKPDEDVSKANRYVDITTFENLLFNKEIIVMIIDPLNNASLQINKNSHITSIDQKILYNNNKINLDYLKYIIMNTNHSSKEFITFNS